MCKEMVNKDYANRPQTDRDSHIYECVNAPGVFRIRLCLYPEHTYSSRGWYGGKVLWGFDQDTFKKANTIGNRWIKYGEYPIKERKLCV
jgi:hypothetical protein